jgi:hypothetical protein
MTLHREDSTFSFGEPERLHVTMLTKFSGRTKAEREALAKTMRHAGRRKPKRALRKKMISKQNERRKALANTAEGLTVTPDPRSASGSVCGSIYDSEVYSQPKPPRNKILRSGVLGESASSLTAAKPPPPKLVPGKMMADIYQVVSRVSQGAQGAESHTIKPMPKLPPSSGNSGGAGIRVKLRTSPGDENKTRFSLETETPVASSTESVKEVMIEVLDQGDKPEVAKRLSEIEELGKRAQERRHEKSKRRSEAEGNKPLWIISDGKF